MRDRTFTCLACILLALACALCTMEAPLVKKACSQIAREQAARCH